MQQDENQSEWWQSSWKNADNAARVEPIVRLLPALVSSRIPVIRKRKYKE